MAWQTKSIVDDGANGHHRFTLNITEDNTNINTNQSYISWSFVLSPIGNGWKWYYSNQIPVTYIVTINGVQYASGNIMSYDGSSTVTIASGGDYITHNADGNKDLSFSFSVWSMGASYLPGAASASGNMPLTYIPRRPSITSAPNFTDEENPTITFTNPAGNAVDNLGVCIVYYDVNGDEQRITINDSDGAYGCYKFLDDKTSTQYTFSLTDAEKNNIYAAIATEKSLSVWFYVTTWIGGNIYHSSLQRTVTIVNADPVINSATVIDIGSSSTSLTGDGNTVISGYNYMQCNISTTPNKGAYIVNKTVSCGSKSATIADTYGILENVESADFIFTVTDSRGNVSTKPISKTLIPYFRPSCSISVNMVLDPNDDTKSIAYVTVSGSYFIGNFGAVENRVLAWVCYKEQGSTAAYTWEQKFDRTSGDSSYSEVHTINGFDSEKTYVFYGVIGDEIFTHNAGRIWSAEYTINTLPVYDYGRDSFNFNVPVTIKDKSINEVVCPEPTVLWNGRLGSDRVNTEVALNENMSNFRTIEVLYSCNVWDHYVQSARMRVGYQKGWNTGDDLGNILPCYDGTWIVFYFPDNTTIRLDNAANNNHIIAIYGWKY